MGLTEEQQQREDLQAMVLDAAGALARRCYETAVQQSFTKAQMEEIFRAGEIEWHLQVTYDKDDNDVTIAGHPHRPAEEIQERLKAAGPLATLFGMRDEDTFQFVVPTRWLPNPDTGF
jgi:hypothetical protein